MEIINKDILTVDKGIICHQVNCQGVMGSGLALQIKKKWPEVYEGYRFVCNAGPVQTLGKVYPHKVSNELFVMNLFGQESFGTDRVHTDYNALASAMGEVANFNEELNLPVYFPYRIGCGLGGGNWHIVTGIIEKIFPDSIICKLS